MIINQVRLTEEPTIHANVSLKNATFEIYNEVGEYNFIENTHFGAYSYTEQFCFLQNVDLGKFVNIAANVRIGAVDHPMERPSLHHFTYRPTMFGLAEKDDEAFFEARLARRTRIGHDVWIGHGATIKPDTIVGNGAVIGSAAVVTKDVPAYAIVAGVPAKLIRYRFDGETAARLEAIQWWDWDYETIKERYEDFRLDVDDFIEKYYRGAKDDIPIKDR